MRLLSQKKIDILYVTWLLASYGVSKPEPALAGWRKSLRMIPWSRLETFGLTRFTCMGGGRCVCVCAVLSLRVLHVVHVVLHWCVCVGWSIWWSITCFSWMTASSLVTHGRSGDPWLLLQEVHIYEVHVHEMHVVLDQMSFSFAVGQRWSDQSQTMKMPLWPRIMGIICEMFFTFPGCRRFIFVLLSSSAFTSSELETCPQNAHGAGWVAATSIHFIHKAVFANAQGILNLSKSKSKVQIKLHLVPRSLDSQKSVWWRRWSTDV